MRKEVQVKKAKKPTIAGTAKVLGIHRDTLYEWMREFDVKFEDVSPTEPTLPAVLKQPAGSVYLIGEALVGEGNEVAHIDLLVGDKEGPVGVEFANALANQSAGHGNLLAVLT